MFFDNAITQLLKIKYPILQGGMAWSSTAKLACAVSNAGGLGIIGCAGRDIQWVSEQLVEARYLTNEKVGINVALNDENSEAIVEFAVSQKVEVFTMGGATSYLPLIRRFGERILIIPIVGSVAEAKFAERAGAKAIIVEGQESGGSIGSLSLFPMLPQIRDSIRVPIIAAGGIADARGMQAAFALGAQGIQMGTRFLASCECEVSQEFKNKILGARDTDSTVIGRKTGRPTRVIRNKFSKEYTELEDKGSNKGSLSDFMRGTLRLAVESDQDNGAIHSGEIAGLIKEVKPAKEIIEDIVLQFKHYDEDRLVPDSNLEIYTYLKHRPPMLLVDSILSRVPKISCTTLLNTNLHRLFFKGHYPDYPILPGTVLLEAMSQAMVISFSDASVNELPKAGFLLREIVNAKFFKEVTPGMILIVNSRTLSYRRGIYHSTISCEQQGREGVVACSEQKIVIPTELISPKTVSKA